MTVDDYLGKVTPADVKLPPPAARRRAALPRRRRSRARARAREHVAAHPERSPTRTIELGAAIGLRASYIATVEGSVFGAFRAAREAYDAHEKVLELDPARADAGLVVGTYRYVVSALSLPMRLFAYIAGFGGGKEKGIQLIEGGRGISGRQPDRRAPALVLLYNRERRYDDALSSWRSCASVSANRLLWLETGSTCLRAGRAADAERVLSEGIARLRDRHAAADVRRGRRSGTDKRGAARAALRPHRRGAGGPEERSR